jgi:hypothetical protein
VTHPDKFNHVQSFKTRLSQIPYKKAIVFVDNSGADVILGIIPFIRHLLRKNTEIILAANSRPAINDITAHELVQVVDRIAEMDGVVRASLEARKLKIVASGSASPCIDFRRISEDLVAEAVGCDLIVLEVSPTIIFFRICTVTVYSLFLGDGPQHPYKLPCKVLSRLSKNWRYVTQNSNPSQCLFHSAFI